MHIFLLNSLLPFLALIICFPLVFSVCPKNKPAVIFNFGDATSDTGGFAAAMAVDGSYAYGRLLSTGLTSRATDGRLIIDFLCEHLGTAYLNPYMSSLGQHNFSNGVNFAVLGACALKPSTSELSPFDLKIQVLQLKHLYKHFDELKLKMLKDHFFQNALYTIDIGQNDLSNSFASSLSLDQVIKNIPSFISEISNAIRAIYQLGGMNIWVHGTGPLGCLPRELATRSNTSSRDLDPYGCRKSLNDGAKAFNAKLHALCKKLQSKLPGSRIVYVDLFTIKYDLIANSTFYGFKNPLSACCGRGGTPNNFDPANNQTCWTNGFSACNKGERYISWDGVHYTQAANAIIASKILSNKYSSPPLQLDVFCSHV